MENPRIWLALSGGGFRAALFHYGFLKRLHELGLLDRVYGISATSGGALIAALYVDSLSCSHPFEEFESRLLEISSEGLIRLPILSFLALILEALGILIFSIKFFYWDSMVLVYIASLLILIGVILHVWMLFRILQLFGSSAQREGSRPNRLWLNFEQLRRLGRMAFSPSWCRREVFSLKLFGDRDHGSLSYVPRVFLAAVDLDHGAEFVFSNRVGGWLNADGCRFLWEQNIAERYFTRIYTHDAEDAAEITDLPLGHSVAASSAFPPFFQPVPLSTPRTHLGTFWDGGIVDNYAVEIPKALAYYTSSDRERYSLDNPDHVPGFSEWIDALFIVDGAGRHTVIRKSSWGRLQALARVADISLIKQRSDLASATQYFQHTLQVPCKAISLRAGLPSSCGVLGERLSDLLADVRTHFDAFEREEIAVLSYAGYMWAEEALRTPDLEGEKDGKSERPMIKPFSELLPHAFRPYECDPEILSDSLSQSKHRLRIWRDVQRTVLRLKNRI